MKALVLNTSLRTAIVEDLDRPTPSAGEILVHVRAIALNPVDELYVTSPIAGQEKRIIGTDFAGVVVEAGPGIDDSSDSPVKSGTRVAGFLQGACSVNDRPGAFAEYITIPYDLVWAVPEGLSLEEASTISMCGLTAAQAIYGRLGLPSPFSTSPSDKPEKESGVTNVFIYGSSTSVGLYAAQLARIAKKASGRPVRLIGAASSYKHEMLRNKPYSYDVLVDYRDPEWVKKVKDATNGKGVDLALDCISENKTVYNTHDTLASSAKFAVIRGPVGGGYDPELLKVKPIYGAVWEGLGVEVGYNGAVLPANPDAHSFAKEFYKFLSKPLPSGRAQLKPNPVRLMPGGLGKVIPDGFSLLGSGSVGERVKLARDEDYMRPISAEKLVYTVN
ncbi:chaperonin 10-like protein [Fusarium avenaceum]|nr:chaperonin 10-like protein [Fusarium avenaceum]